jgi:hypothetical protein
MHVEDTVLESLVIKIRGTPHSDRLCTQCAKSFWYPASWSNNLLDQGQEASLNVLLVLEMPFNMSLTSM